MIEEIRIMSRTGANIFSGKIDLNSSEVQMADTDVLFAGFISAILSVSEELQNSDIRELGYQESKIIFTMTENLIFLGFADTRVPNSDVQELLDVIVAKWMVQYDDMEYPFVPDEMRQNLIHMIHSSIKEVFWWAVPNYNVNNNIRLLKNAFSKPGGMYYAQYLPWTYLITGLLIFMLPLAVVKIYNVAFTGFSSGKPQSGTPNEVFLASTITLLLFVFGSALVLKIMYRGEFNEKPFLMLTLVYSGLFSIMLFVSSGWYIFDFLPPIYGFVQDSILLFYLTQMFLLFAPLNLGFFGFVILTAYATSNTNIIDQKTYFVSYLLVFLFMISLAQFITQGLIGVAPIV